MEDKFHREFRDTKAEEKKLYEEYKKKLDELKKVKVEHEAVGQVFTKGLLPIYTLYILQLAPTNGNDICQQIGKRTKGLWIPSTGGIYPLLKKLEKQGFIKGTFIAENKSQKIYEITEEGIEEFQNRKTLLKLNIDGVLEVFKIIREDLYND